MITERNIITRTTHIYPGKTLNGKTQQKLPQYRFPKKIKGKTQNTDPPPSPATALSLLCATQVSVCVSNEERHTSIYILPFT